MAEKVDDHLQPVPQDIMGSVTRTDPETLRQYEETGKIAWQYSDCSFEGLKKTFAFARCEGSVNN